MKLNDGTYRGDAAGKTVPAVGCAVAKCEVVIRFFRLEVIVQVCLESTDKIVELNGVPARIWEGHTAAGVPCHAYVTRIAVSESEDSTQFEQELQHHRVPSVEIQAIPLRLVL